MASPQGSSHDGLKAETRKPEAAVTVERPLVRALGRSVTRFRATARHNAAIWEVLAGSCPKRAFAATIRSRFDSGGSHFEQRKSQLRISVALFKTRKGPLWPLPKFNPSHVLQPANRHFVLIAGRSRTQPVGSNRTQQNCGPWPTTRGPTKWAVNEASGNAASVHAGKGAGRSAGRCCSARSSRPAALSGRPSAGRRSSPATR